MIKANELRIGNWVNFCYSYSKQQICRACQVISIGTEIVVLDKGVSLVAKFDPIPLTTEILEKYKGGINYFVFGDYFLLQDMGGWHFDYIDDNNRGDRAIAYPEYLHQLQNLYFALTGNELEIKL